MNTGIMVFKSIMVVIVLIAFFKQVRTTVYEPDGSNIVATLIFILIILAIMIN